MRDSESIEIAALMDLHNAATPELKRSLAISSKSIGSARISIAANLPESAVVINRTLGFKSSFSPEIIEKIAAIYSEQAVERYFIQTGLRNEDDRVEGIMTSAGLVKARGWQKFRRGKDAVGAVNTDLDIRPIRKDYSQEFASIVCDAFDLGRAAVPWLAELPDRPNWHIFMSFDGDMPAGAGALFVKNGLGWTDWGATAPEFRRRGSQTAILAARLKCALELGCTSVFTCTGEDVPGDPQHSYTNIMRAGFAEDYLSENYAPPSP